MTLLVVPFADRHRDPAAALLAERLAAQRAGGADLPASLATATGTRPLVDAVRSWPGLVGVAAVDGDRLAGFLLGSAAPPVGQPSVTGAAYVSPSGHAALPELAAEVYPALYAAVGARWVTRGCLAHHVEVGAHDGAALEAWRMLGFGTLFTTAVAATSPTMRPPDAAAVIRQATHADLDDVVGLIGVLRRHHAAGPVFHPPPIRGADGDREYQRRVLADPRSGCWLAVLDGRAVGVLVLRPPGQSISPAYLPDDAIHLDDAVVDDCARGHGIGAALVDEALGWAHVLGYRACILHHYPANLGGSRFWRRRGFAPVGHHLVRRLDPRVATAAW